MKVSGNSVRFDCRGGVVSFRLLMSSRGRSLIQTVGRWSRSSGFCGISWLVAIGLAVSVVMPMSFCAGGDGWLLLAWSGTRPRRPRSGTRCCGWGRPPSPATRHRRRRSAQRALSIRQPGSGISVISTSPEPSDMAMQCCGAFMSSGSSSVAARWSTRWHWIGGAGGRTRTTIPLSRFGLRAASAQPESPQTQTAGNAR